MAEYLFGDQFASYIKSMIPGTREASGKKELVCRCRYCPDSSDPNHGHMYIKVPQADDDIPLFHCFKCQTSGVIDSRTLIEWGVYDPVLGSELDKIAKKASTSKKFSGYNRTWYPFVNYVGDLRLAEYKLNYINSRIGTNLQIKDCIQQKIILNIRDALDHNAVPSYTRHPSIIEQLNSQFVGFLSLDNNFVNLRRICDEGRVYHSIDKRYINYNIHDKKDNTEKMYIMPTILDLSVPEKVNIHVAEGPFDILSIKYNLRRNEPGIFAAITGSGYRGLVMHLISTFKIFYFNLHIYPDNDTLGDAEMIESLAELIYPYNNTITIHRNMYPGEKDFGVTPDRIKEKVYINKI